MSEKINIIIAENQKLFRGILISTLAEYGICTIAEADDGAELMALLQVHRPDIVLLDIEMPVMSGDKALIKISREFPNVKVIILSQYDEQQLIVNYILNGAHAYVTKGMAISMLLEAIHNVKRHGSYYNNIPVAIRELIRQSDDAHLKNTNFSRRESEIIPLICDGKTNKDIANELNIVVKTVEAHRKNIYKKTHATSVTEFIKYTLKKGFAFLIKQ